MSEELVPIFYVKDAQQTAKWYARLGFDVEGEHGVRLGMEQELDIAHSQLFLT